MKIVKGKDDRDVEEIHIWDGPCMDQIIYLEKGRPYFLVPTTGEDVVSAKYIAFTERAYKLNLDSNEFRPLEYVRTNREDEEGRVYFAMKSYLW